VEQETLGEIIKKHGGLIQTGPFGSQLHQHDYVESGIPVVMPKDISSGRVSTESIAYISENKAQELSRHILPSPSLVMPRRGDVSKRAFIQEDQAGILCGTGCIQVRVPESVLNPRFFYYYLEQHQITDWLTRNAIGTTMLNLSAKIIGGIPVSLMPLDSQKKIVNILSTYDDLIENNRRRIQLLEESARLLYREWFVHLRFPGHEHVKVVDGVPEGWERKILSEVCDTVGGGTPSTQKPEYWVDGDIPWVVPTDVTRNNSLALLDTEKKITESGLRNSSAKMVPPYTILMTSRASVGFFALLGKEVCTNQGFINIIPNEDYARMYILFNLLYRVEEIRSHAGGATYKEINKTRFRALPIIIPTQLLLKEFNEASYLSFQQVRALEQQNQKLQKARDLLLPRLINDEITV
jgi:type I restriction enzyme S subunit